MKNSDPVDYFVLFVFIFASLLFISTPVILVGKVITTQQTLNQECGSKYTLLQVALAGDNLARLCQIKNQQITIK